MRDTGKRLALAAAFFMTLLMVSGARAANSDVPLVEAARNQDQQQVRTLLNQRADVNARSGDGSTALLWAAHWNALETAELLIRAGADVRATNQYSATPLSAAAEIGAADVLELLLKAGADAESPNAEGQTALMAVARTDPLSAAATPSRGAASCAYACARAPAWRGADRPASSRKSAS